MYTGKPPGIAATAQQERQALPKKCRMSLLFGALFAVLFIASAEGSTVTLTGSCAAQTVNAANNVFVFNLTNYGNGTATDLYLAPLLSGVSTSNSVVLLPVISPGAHYSESFYLYNFSMPGSYAEYFIANYTQGTETFTTIFPCILDVNKSSRSIVQVSSINQSKGTLNVLLVNYYNGTINATVHVQAPSSFAILEPDSSFALGPLSQKRLLFNITTPEYASASFPISVAVSYTSNGVHYAAIAQTSVVFGGTGALGASGLQLTTIAIVAVIVILLMLIAVSAVRKHVHAEPKR